MGTSSEILHPFLICFYMYASLVKLSMFFWKTGNFSDATSREQFSVEVTDGSCVGSNGVSQRWYERFIQDNAAPLQHLSWITPTFRSSAWNVIHLLVSWVFHSGRSFFSTFKWYICGNTRAHFLLFTSAATEVSVIFQTSKMFEKCCINEWVRLYVFFRLLSITSLVTGRLSTRFRIFSISFFIRARLVVLESASKAPNNFTFAKKCHFH